MKSVSNSSKTLLAVNVTDQKPTTLELMSTSLQME